MKYAIKVYEETQGAWDDEDEMIPLSGHEVIFNEECENIVAFVEALEAVKWECGLLTWSAHPQANAKSDWLMSVDDAVDVFTGVVTRYSVHFTLPAVSKIDFTSLINRRLGVYKG
jgi:hypothetical protein